jgi:glutathionylspermidine synthase
MIRRDCKARPDFQNIVQNQGLLYHTNPDGSAYWLEEAYYILSSGEVDQLYEAAKELHEMFLAAADFAIQKKGGLDELEIPASLHESIRRSWDNDEWEFYGRFDLAFDAQGTPKLIEYNADTPTGLLEASIIQWYWKNEQHPRNDQFNAIHERLVARWKALMGRGQIKQATTCFTSVANHTEDRMTVGYLAQTAEEAGIPTKYLPIRQIGWDRKRLEFVDEQNAPIQQIFKLYPWEWLGVEAFAAHLAAARWTVLEPAWKVVLASKKLLLILQQLFPNHPNLLAVSDRPLRGDFVSKPVFGREGANVTVYKNGVVADRRDGGEEGQSLVFQEYCALSRTKPGCFTQCGVWMAGPEPVGLGMREDARPILSNISRFVPHIIR